MAEHGVYIGIDIDDSYAVVSYLAADAKEPETVSMIAGKEVFQIPVQIAKEDRLLSRALQQEEIFVDGTCYPAEELLVLFLRKLIGYACSLCRAAKADGLSITVAKTDRKLIELLQRVCEKLGFTEEQFVILDRKAAFYYFVFRQAEELYLHDVCLYDYRGGQMKCLRLARNLSTIPQKVTIEETVAEITDANRDEAFYQLLQKHLKGYVASAVYLIGDAFEGDWMKLSLEYICRGRRAFIGKNLYAKGACYALWVKREEQAWPYIYLGADELKVTVSLKVNVHGKEEFFPLLHAGDNWYEAKGGCEVILNDTKEISVRLQWAESGKAGVKNLVLHDLPERENKTTRLKIMAKPVSDTKVQILIQDLGFGEIVKSSGKSWEYSVTGEG